MNALVIYESMFGNTRRIAEAIAEGLGGNARAVAVGAVSPDDLAGAELLVVGGPTHAFGMTRPKTRAEAARTAGQSHTGPSFEGDFGRPGLREWIAATDLSGRQAAAFDTRVRIPFPTPHAASKIGRALHQRGARLVASPRGFWATKANDLEAGQVETARDFGRQLAALVPTGPQR